MLSDARELANDQQIEADVCIIGAGPAGISIARELIGHLSMMAEAVRSVATLAKARQRRPLLAGMAGHLGNVATGLGDLGVFARNRLRRPDEARGVRASAARPGRAGSRTRIPG